MRTLALTSCSSNRSRHWGRLGRERLSDTSGSRPCSRGRAYASSNGLTSEHLDRESWRIARPRKVINMKLTRPDGTPDLPRMMEILREVPTFKETMTYVDAMIADGTIKDIRLDGRFIGTKSLGPTIAAAVQLKEDGTPRRGRPSGQGVGSHGFLGP